MTKPDPNAELLPCPFCGSDDLETCANAVDCQNCGGGVCLDGWQPGMEGDEAIAAWNTRAPPPTPIPDDGGEGVHTPLTHADDKLSIAWLVERQGPTYAFCNTLGSWGWTSDHLTAFRFPDKAEAERWQNHYAHDATVVEHAWMAPNWKARALQAEGRVKELEEGLRPFADAGRQVPPPVSDDATCAYFRDTKFTAGVLRKARALLSSKEG